MALKFRRGTTAQKSGSLAFGEPYVNTTLGTLQIGLDTGDVTLSAIGTGSNIAVAGISGSSLDITGNGKIDGNLTLGGNITIGDAGTDTISINADLSSSIIPDTTNVFDLGSPTKVYRNVYANTLSGSAVEIVSNIQPELRILNTLTNISYHFQSSNGGNLNIHNNTTGKTLLRFLSASVADAGNTEIYGNLSVLTGSITATGGFIGSIAATNGVVSGSSQIIGILDSLNSATSSYATTASLNSASSSIDTRINGLYATLTGSYATTSSLNTISSSLSSRISTEKERVDAILSAADADKDSFAEIVTLINSVDLTNDTSFASFYTASVGRLNNLESTSGSNNTRLSALEVETNNLESFTSSINTTIKSKLDADGVISSSAQLTTTFDTRYLNTGGDSVVSGSSQIAFSGVTGTVSNAQLANSTISGKSLGTNLDTLTIGTGLSGTSYNGSSAVTIANTGVTAITAGTGVSRDTSTGNVTISIGQSVATNATPTFGNLTINGTITATGDITAYYTSDKRHKNNIQIIPNALEKISKLNGVTWEWNDDVNEVTKSTPKTGLIAQEVQEVLPQVVVERENGYLGLDYSKMMGLLVEAIKEQQTQIHSLKLEIQNLKESKGL